jgi:hypothetical protein
LIELGLGVAGGLIVAVICSTVKIFFQMRVDLNHAFTKIRELEKKA